MKTTKPLIMDPFWMRACLSLARRSHTKSIAARKKRESAKVGSLKREAARIDETRESSFALGIMFALGMLEGTAQDARRRNPRPAHKITPTQKATP